MERPVETIMRASRSVFALLFRSAAAAGIGTAPMFPACAEPLSLDRTTGTGHPWLDGNA